MNTNTNPAPLRTPTEDDVLEARGAWGYNATSEEAAPILSPEPRLASVEAYGPLSIGITARRIVLGLPKNNPAPVLALLSALGLDRAAARKALSDRVKADASIPAAPLSRETTVRALAGIVEDCVRAAVVESRSVLSVGRFLGVSIESEDDGYGASPSLAVAYFLASGPEESKDPRVLAFIIGRDPIGTPVALMIGCGPAELFGRRRADLEALARFARSPGFGTNR